MLLADFAWIGRNGGGHTIADTTLEKNKSTKVAMLGSIGVEANFPARAVIDTRGFG